MIGHVCTSPAQVWEETAAKYVSIESELAGVAALATRWRRLELASWRGTLARVTAAHAASARHSWFHLYQVGLLSFELLGQQKMYQVGFFVSCLVGGTRKHV